MHYQEVGECSICGCTGSDSAWIKLTQSHLSGVAYAVIPGHNREELYFYLCPKCKHEIDDWVAFKTVLEEKRVKALRSVSYTNADPDSEPITISAAGWPLQDTVFIGSVNSKIIGEN